MQAFHFFTKLDQSLLLGLRAIKQLLGAPDYARKLGINGREQIRNNFLITLHIKDYLLLFLSLFEEGEVVYL